MAAPRMADPNSVRLIPYGRQVVEEDDIRRVAETLRSAWLTQGPAVAEFENAVARQCGAAGAVAVNSGTGALYLAAQALNIKPGGEVITTPITFAATANAVLSRGGTVRFADIDPLTGNIDPASVEPLIGPRTVGIISVDFAGQMCDYAELGALAKRHGLWLLEDASHAIGSEIEVEGVRRFAGGVPGVTAAVFSFHPVKTITCGEGGMVVGGDLALLDEVAFLRSHGITRDQHRLEKKEGPWWYEMQALSGNYRMPDINAALGLAQLAKLERFKARRRELWARYNEAFAGMEELTLPVEKPGSNACWHLYALRWKMERLVLGKRELFEEMARRGIGVNLHYIPLYRHPYYRDRVEMPRPLPEAERYYAGAMTIPLHCAMTDADQARVIEAIRTVAAEFKR